MGIEEEEKSPLAKLKEKKKKVKKVSDAE